MTRTDLNPGTAVLVASNNLMIGSRKIQKYNPALKALQSALSNHCYDFKKLLEHLVRASLVCLCLIVAASAASAQTSSKKSTARSPAVAAEVPRPKVWDKEPEAFLGIRLGEPLSVVNCPTKLLSYSRLESLDYDALKGLDGVCIDPTGGSSRYLPNARTLANLPNLGIGYTATVYLKNNVVSSINIELKQDQFAVLLDAFKTRFGVPTEVEINTVKTQAGAEFSAADVRWAGKKITIRMFERLLRADESIVVISDNAIQEADLAERRAKQANEAQKF